MRAARVKTEYSLRFTPSTAEAVDYTENVSSTSLVRFP
jgi:hypothetical protein